MPEDAPELNKGLVLDLVLLFVCGLLLFLIAAYFSPIGTNQCYLNGQAIHGNLTMQIQHWGSTSRAELSCP
jgi:hypothetical protein